MKPETRVTAVCLNAGVWLSCLLALLLFAAAQPPGALAQGGTRVAHRNLEELVSDVRVILLGRVLSVRSEPHPQYAGLLTVVVTLEPIDVLKGQASAPFSFRQYALDPRDARTKMNYKIGEEVLLLLHGAHPQTGLSSPAGLEQGRFRITRDSQGNRLATNGFNNAALFRNMDPAKNPKLQPLDVQTRQMITQQGGGPISYGQLKSVIQALVGNSVN